MDYFDDPHLCLICFGCHPLKYCKYFKTFTTVQRIYLIGVHRYCPICFSKAHQLNECSLRKNCTKCDGPHHTMLHPMEEELSEHEASSQHRYRCATCGLWDAEHSRRLQEQTPFQCSGHYQNEQRQCVNTACRHEQSVGMSHSKHGGPYARSNSMSAFASLRQTSIDLDCNESRCGLINSNIPCRSESSRRQCPSTITTENPSFSRSSRQYTRNPKNVKREYHLQQGCNKQTCGNVFGSKPYPSRSNEESNDSTSQSFGFWRKSPSFDCSSNNSHAKGSSSPGSAQSSCSIPEYPASLRVNMGYKDATEDIVSSDPVLKFKSQQVGGNVRSHKGTKAHSYVKHANKNEQTLSNSRQTSSTKAGKVSDSYGKTKKSSKNTKGKKSDPANEMSGRKTTCSSVDKTTPSVSDKGTNTMFNGHIENLYQIQLHLQHWLHLLQKPKEYWHTAAKWRRQALLRQELSQLKLQLKKLVLDIEEYRNLHSSICNKTSKQQECLAMLFQHLLTLLEKCRATSSNRQVLSCVHQLMDHLRHQIKMKHITNAKLFRFQYFLRELKTLELSCQEAGGDNRVDLLQQRLSLRHILRNLLKAALQQLTIILR